MAKKSSNKLRRFFYFNSLPVISKEENHKALMRLLDIATILFGKK